MKWILPLFLISLSAQAQELKVLTWNTFLIPPPYNFTKQAQRTLEMKALLPTLDHDLMFFQETFFDKKRNTLIRALKDSHPFIALPKKGRKLKQIQDSGLFIASRYPLKVLDQVIFSRCAKEDCFSSKSAILVEVTLPNDQKIQMINTHLQAWNEPKTIEVRRTQFLQIKEMLSRHEVPGVPQVLVGDLNVDARVGPEYESSLSLLGMVSGPLTGDLVATNGFSTAGCFKNPGDGVAQEWIDHMWLKSNGAPTVIVAKKVLPLMGLINYTECPLSDHYALEAKIKL